MTKPAKLGAEPWSWASLLWLLLCPWNAWIRAGEQGKLEKAAWESAIPCLTVPGTGEWECSLAAQPFGLVTLAAGLLGETVISHPGLLKAMQCGISISNDRRAGVANRALAVFNVSLHLGRQASHGFGVPFSSFLSGKGLDG